MNEIRDILIGFDFGREVSQISYYDRKASEALSVSVKVGSSIYEFPSCICRRTDREEWCFGSEAQYFARERRAILVDNIYECCEKEKKVLVAGTEYSPGQLTAHFLGKALETLGSVDFVGHVKCLVITVERLTETMVRNLQEACRQLGLSEEQYLLQDYSESFFYYTLSQRPEFWSRNVAWYDFQGDEVCFRKMNAGFSARPILVALSAPQTEKLSEDENIRDLEFYKFIIQTTGEDIYSSIFITGKGFSQKWAVKSVPLLCTKKRRVFVGTNMFARGACYTAKEKKEDRKLKAYLYASDALVTVNIGMDMMVMGSPAYHSILSAGKNWYESQAQCELILDDRTKLVFVLSKMQTGEKKKISMDLEGLPARPNKTTRLRLKLVWKSVKDCLVTVEDLGFGDLFPSSGKIWKEIIRWEE